MNLVEKMIKENYENSKSLTKENDAVYTDIVCYIRGSSMEEVKQEEIISDILEMLLRGQGENKNINEIIGNDYKEFCDSIIEASGSKKSMKSELGGFARLAGYCFLFMLTLDFITTYLPMAINKKQFIDNYSITLNNILVPIIIIVASYAIVMYITKNSFKLSKTRFSKLQNFIFGAVVAAIFLGIGFLGVLAGKVVLFKISTAIIIAVLMIFWMYMLIKTILRKKRLVN